MKLTLQQSTELC